MSRRTLLCYLEMGPSVCRGAADRAGLSVEGFLDGVGLVPEFRDVRADE